MNLLAALVNQCFGPQGAGLTEIKGALCLSRLPHVCFTISIVDVTVIDANSVGLY